MAAPWDNRTVQYGNTTFEIRKLNAMAGRKAFEIIRPYMGRAIAALDVGPLLQGIQGLMEDGGQLNLAALSDEETSDLLAKVVQGVGTILSEVPSKVVDQLEAALFARVMFRSKATGDRPVPIIQNPDTAFQGLEAAHVYMLLVRAVIVNFGPSFAVVQSLFNPTPEDGNLPATQT